VASTRNRHAGRLLKSWRLDRGLSPEQLAWEIAQAKLGFISGRQIRRIEAEGIVPTPRVMFALASHFGAKPSDVWHREVARA
jgi:DNA-binding XRE family transcriptional regulator